MQLFGLGIPEIILILVVLLLFFGKDKLPELAKSIGTSFKELKKGFSAELDSPAKEKEKSDDVSKKSK
jgi:sec-independent protein translocase protein TatA